MPIRSYIKGSRKCFRVANTSTKKCLTKKQAEKQLKAIKISQRRRFIK